MALFIVRHQHDADRCPATDPYMGATLLNYLSRPNVRKHGVSIQGEAVVRGEHMLYMIVESSDEAQVREFMQPFSMAGSVGSTRPLPVRESWPAVAVELPCRRWMMSCPPWIPRKPASKQSTEGWWSTALIHLIARRPFLP